MTFAFSVKINFKSNVILLRKVHFKFLTHISSLTDKTDCCEVSS